MIKPIIIRSFFLLILPFISYSQTNEVLERQGNKFIKRFALGVLVQGQTKYPSPYYGPEVKSLYNDGSYHFMVDFYIKKFLIGFQLTDEYLYLEKTDGSGAIWKPRGFNKSYSSLTRAYWISLGYNVFNDINFKLSLGFRNGPSNSLFLNNKDSSEIAKGFNYEDPSNIFNQSVNYIDTYSEVDFSLSFNYPILIYKKFGVVPELGYSFKYGGIISGVSIMFINQLYE